MTRTANTAATMTDDELRKWGADNAARRGAQLMDGELEAPKPTGRLFKIKNTVLRRAALVAISVAAVLVLSLVSVAFTVYVVGDACWDGLKAMWSCLAPRFSGTGRALKIAELIFRLAWDRDAVKDPDGAMERVQARAERWRK